MKEPNQTAGVIASPRDTLAVARVVARKGRLATLADLVSERFRIALPDGPRRAGGSKMAFVGVGAETWLAMSDADANVFGASLQQTLDRVAAVSDQSSAALVMRLSGRHLRQTLAKFIALDLHEREFPVDHAAVTIASHITINLWRLPDGSDALPRFEIAVPRSYAESFRHVLLTAAAEFGLSGPPAS